MNIIKWKSGILDIPNNTSYGYSVEYRYCRCLEHSPGTSDVHEIYYDTFNHEWGDLIYENNEYNFIKSCKINPPYYWCYLRDVEAIILNDSEFPCVYKL